MSDSTLYIYLKWDKGCKVEVRPCPRLFERYIALVEYMHNKDLVMRTLINDVELLILASTTLCNDSQRWNNEHFLWGLFYRMRQDKDRCVEGGSHDSWRK
ncbi:hypothetical protein KY290_023729 [Solanum tuberosum]|uniref:AIPP2-like SPOC-like domain-containing protein n=1 Tax=Solanum tuberosum TaxID=4113 RepID=A0ABQ7V9Y2_SOLTU|nr:hypothetical protein KY289_022815 [Solanum tuberosum]KAH0760236.1 hypothetical protein KY290_023729 [Solanum tuberosum]